jgi:hypothetical protein
MSSILDAGYWMLDAGYWLLDTGYWLLDAGYWMLDAGYWLLDAGCWIATCDLRPVKLVSLNNSAKSEFWQIISLMQTSRIWKMGFLLPQE